MFGSLLDISLFGKDAQLFVWQAVLFCGMFENAAADWRIKDCVILNDNVFIKFYCLAIHQMRPGGKKLVNEFFLYFNTACCYIGYHFGRGYQKDFIGKDNSWRSGIENYALGQACNDC